MVSFVIYVIATGTVLSSLPLSNDLTTTTMVMRLCQQEAARRKMQFIVTRPDLGFRCERRSAATIEIFR